MNIMQNEPLKVKNRLIRPTIKNGPKKMMLIKIEDLFKRPPAM